MSPCDVLSDFSVQLHKNTFKIGKISVKKQVMSTWQVDSISKSFVLQSVCKVGLGLKRSETHIEDSRVNTEININTHKIHKQHIFVALLMQQCVLFFIVSLVTFEESTIGMRPLMPSECSFALVSLATEATGIWFPVAVSQHMGL